MNGFLMKIKDITKRFNDNSRKVRKKLVFHWTGGSTAEGAIEWLDKRLNGKGSVGYNYIIDDKTIYLLAHPSTRWMYNTGRGTTFDSDTISVSFVGSKDGDITHDKLVLAKELVDELRRTFDIYAIHHHAELSNKKQDFPSDTWRRIKRYLKTDE